MNRLIAGIALLALAAAAPACANPVTAAKAGSSEG